MNSPLHELVVATHSPFHADGSLAPEVVPSQAAFLSANGIRTVFITGSTGEGHSLTCAERLALYEVWSTVGPAEGLQVIAHVGGNCLEDAKILARAAEKLGFAAISALAPSYYKPGSLSGLIDCCAAIAAEAPKTPFYHYDIPSMTGVSFPMEKFLVEAAGQVPTLAGIKFTNPDLVSYRRSLEVAGSRFDLPWGVDEMLLAALATGAKGGVGSTYNWAPKLYLDLIAAFERGDLEEARRLQGISIAMIDAIAKTGFLGTAKALMGRLGVEVGPARLPLGNPTEVEVDSLMERLEELGFGEWGARKAEMVV
ncbi:dihydrodipicolinate synthase family protein [Haloferula sp. BvORR071]|uniref:dihydrodipicolinate synthase family protein n=1 Tax=Haloferula sp. BvORR071 TaxID=1396141 RepID=UPI00055803A7|nr:dihydrodipicolinate synthase family protein [Haloferula sp. BvORR071]